MAYVCFIVDAFSRMIVGWRVAAHSGDSGHLFRTKAATCSG
jgi:transposase InsO family protein